MGRQAEIDQSVQSFYTIIGTYHDDDEIYGMEMSEGGRVFQIMAHQYIEEDNNIFVCVTGEYMGGGYVHHDISPEDNYVKLLRKIKR